MEEKEKRLFSNEDSAELFSREFAICQLTGRNLWILDSGIINWDSVQIDHIVPYSKGGKTDLSNVALLAGHANFNANDSRSKFYNFEFGFPSINYFYDQNVILENHKEHLLKFVRLLSSDFYFNRALENFLFGIDFRINPKRVNGKIKVRDDKYHAKVVINTLKKWEETKEKNWQTFENRNLINKKLEIDQKILLKVRDAKTELDVMNLYDELEPIAVHLNKCQDLFHKCYYSVINNFVCSVTFDGNIKLDDYVQTQFQPLIDLLKDKNTIPRYKDDVLDTIKFLKKYCCEIKRYKFFKINTEFKKAKFYVGTYKDALKLEKKENDWYFQTTEKINCRFKKELIDFNVGNILKFDGDEENWGKNVPASDMEFLLTRIDVYSEINYYFLTNENEEKHIELLKKILEQISTLEVHSLK